MTTIDLFLHRTAQQALDVKYRDQLAAISGETGIPAEQVLQLAVAADPTGRTYVGWILKQMRFQNIRLPEDTQRVYDVLKNFVNYARVPGIEHDIGRYRTIHDLEEVLDGLTEGDVPQTKRERVEELKAGATWVKDSQNYAVLQVTTPEAACFYGKNTKWCTSNPDTARSYLADGPLFVVFKKEGGQLLKIGQFSHDMGQFMDVRDRSIAQVDEELASLMTPW